MSLDAQKPEKIEEPKDLKLNPEQISEMSHGQRIKLQKEVAEKAYERFEDDNEKLNKTADFFEEKASGGVYFSDNYTVNNWIDKIEIQAHGLTNLVKLIKPPTVRLLNIYDEIYLNLNRAKEYIENCERAKFKMPISKEVIRDTEALLISALSQIMQ
ncbi:MAG: hypothetical protein US89_C0003G0007 [Candidatus Peregrinibacteria bacterium GW2011_GWF2_38_29]|nr:MAG: hypothetical protein US89_C0003G0007 [Candidatus Peregrinibacteria bacterium GW2011_GWF2_38_29]HBB02889.1 hypothetical protein [Candidatus Peregrinibacteria bacterium]